MKYIITIGREYGSGGREIGYKLAKLLDIPYYDKEMMAMFSKESGLTEEVLSHYDEKKESLLYSLIMDLYATDSNLKGEPPLHKRLQKVQVDVINQIADKGSCVIVGRCADYILKDRGNVLSIFISADTDNKIERVATRNNISPEQAKKRMKETDNKRRNHYNYNTNQKWGASYCYDLCIKSDKLGIEKTALALKNYIDFLEEDMK